MVPFAQGTGCALRLALGKLPLFVLGLRGTRAAASEGLAPIVLAVVDQDRLRNAVELASLIHRIDDVVRVRRVLMNEIGQEFARAEVAPNGHPREDRLGLALLVTDQLADLGAESGY